VPCKELFGVKPDVFCAPVAPAAGAAAGVVVVLGCTGVTVAGAVVVGVAERL
jgi:hypothetical protein